MCKKGLQKLLVRISQVKAMITPVLFQAWLSLPEWGESAAQCEDGQHDAKEPTSSFGAKALHTIMLYDVLGFSLLFHTNYWQIFTNRGTSHRGV